MISAKILANKARVLEDLEFVLEDLNLLHHKQLYESVYESDLELSSILRQRQSF